MPLQFSIQEKQGAQPSLLNWFFDKTRCCRWF